MRLGVAYEKLNSKARLASVNLVFCPKNNVEKIFKKCGKTIDKWF